MKAKVDRALQRKKEQDLLAQQQRQANEAVLSGAKAKRESLQQMTAQRIEQRQQEADARMY